MMNALRTRLSHRAGDAGASLTELLVTMFVSGIVLAIVGTMFVNVARITTNSNASTQRNSIAGNIMSELSKVIRTASTNPTSGTPDPAIISGTGTALTLYSYVDANPASPAPTKVGFRIDAQGQVIEDRWTASISNSYWVFTGSPTSRPLGGPVTTAAAPLFSYIEADGDVITVASSGLTAAQRATVASVRVNVTLDNTLTTGADPIIVVNTVGMPNLKLSRTED